MSRTLLAHAARVAATAALTATTVFAQTGDTTRTGPPGRTDGAPPAGGMRPRMGARPMAPRGAWQGDPRGSAGRRALATPGRRGPVGVRPAGFARGAFLMRGITLSVDQQKSLRANQARQILAAKPLMLELMSARTDQQLARLNGDQRSLDAAVARLELARTKLDSLRARRSPTDDLRAVLTPEQQKLLDRNLTEAATRGAARAWAPGIGGRGWRDDVGGRGIRPGAPMRGFRGAPPFGPPGASGRPGDEELSHDVESGWELDDIDFSPFDFLDDDLDPFWFDDDWGWDFPPDTIPTGR